MGCPLNLCSCESKHSEDLMGLFQQPSGGSSRLQSCISASQPLGDIVRVRIIAVLQLLASVQHVADCRLLRLIRKLSLTNDAFEFLERINLLSLFSQR